MVLAPTISNQMFIEALKMHIKSKQQGLHYLGITLLLTSHNLALAEGEGICSISDIQQLDSNEFILSTDNQSPFGQTFRIEYDFNSGLIPEARVSDFNNGEVIHTDFFTITGGKICDRSDRSRCYPLYNSQGEMDLTEYTKHLFTQSVCAKQGRTTP